MASLRKHEQQFFPTPTFCHRKSSLQTLPSDRYCHYDCKALPVGHCRIASAMASCRRHNPNLTRVSSPTKSDLARERLTYPLGRYKTSTLQQKANQRLSVKEVMRTAQELDEAGWMYCMRTDATHLSEDTIATTLQAITEAPGPHIVAMSSPKQPAKKKKNCTASVRQVRTESL